MANICMGCLNPLPEGDEVCRICGFSDSDQNPEKALKINSTLQDHYVVGRMICEGSDSMIYLGYDRVLKEPCFIHEYFPSTLCQRDENGQVTPLGGCEHAYADYAAQFQSTMRAIARVKELPCIIPIYDLFEENGTHYTVSDYCAGESLTKKIERAGGRIPWQEARPLFMSLITCVEQIAGANIHHLAICPDNILVSEDGKPHLRGFSIAAARQVGSDLQPRLCTGFAAPEQYEYDATVSEATDVYGLAATIFCTVTGNEPPAGNNRAKDSDDLFMSAEIAEELTQQVCVALFNALQVSPDERTASVAKFHQQLSMEPNVSALLDEDSDNAKPAKNEKSKRGRTLLIVFAAVAAALLLVVAVLLGLLGGRGEQEVSGDDPVSLPQITTTTTTTKKNTKYSVPSLVGQNYYSIKDNKTNGEFIIEIKQKEYSDKEEGIILSQEPQPGESVEKGATITVVVSLGKNDEIIVPQLAGWKEEQAKLFLEERGFKVEVAELFVSEYAYGEVERTDPPADTVKMIGDTVTIFVSRVEAVTPEEPVSESEPAEEDESLEGEQPTEEDGHNDIDAGNLFE